MASLLKKAERQVRTPQSKASLRGRLLSLVAEAREAVKTHESGVMKNDSVAHGMLAKKYQSLTYPQIRRALNQAENSLGR